MSPAAAFPETLFRAWVSLVRRMAWVVVALSLLSAALTVVYLARKLAINTDTTDMLSAELPFRQNNREVSRLFPQLSDNILLVLDGSVPELVDRAAAGLSARLTAEPELFGEVFDPEGDPFLQNNGLLFLSVDGLEELTGRLAEAQPFLASLWGETSLATLFELLGKGVDQQLAGEAPPVALAKVLDMLSEVGEARLAGKDEILSWRRLLAGEDAGTARRMIVLKPPLDFGSLQPAGKPITALKALRRDLQLDGQGGVRLRISGSAALQQDELKSVERGMGLAGALSFVLVFGLLICGLRSPRLVMAVLATLICGLIWTAGFAIWALGALNLISVAFAVLFIGLSVDFGIHFVLRYREHRAAGLDNGPALEATAAAGGGGLALCAIAAAIAFYSFLPTDYVGLAELGLIAGSGMFIALFANLTVLPALLVLMPVSGAMPGGAVWPRTMRRALQARPGRVLVGAGVLAAAGLSLSPKAHFDFDPLNLQDRSLESVAVVHELAAGEGATAYSATALAKDAATARALAANLSALPEVAGVASIHSFVPDDQDEKADIVGDLALFMLPSLPAGGGTGDADPVRRRQAASDLARALAGLAGGTAGNNAGQELSAAAKRFSELLGKLDPAGLEDLETGLLAVFPDAVRRLRETLNPAPFGINDLPAGIRARYIAESGQARLDIVPAEDLRDPAAVERFVSAVRRIAPEVSGSPVTIFEAGRAVLSAFVEAGAIAVTAILLLLAVLLRRARDVVYVFVPLALAAVLTITCSVVLNVPFNFANIIVLPLLFGLGVASGIHLVLRDRQERRGDAPAGAFETSTPRAVLYSALTTIGSFGSIALSGHPGTASMGVLLTIAITLTLICTLVLLPALLAGGQGAVRGSGA
jgi:hopanoid biosynthesis associated RND transporter like protein HpnN